MSDLLLERLRAADPVEPEAIRDDPLPIERLRRIPLIAADAPIPAPRRWRMLSIGVALAAVAIVAVLGLLPTGTPGGASPDAVRVLDAQAAIASAQTAPASPGGFTYYKLIGASLGTFADPDAPYSFRIPSVTETWVAPDGSGEVREVRKDIQWPGPRDEQRWRSQGSPALGPDEGVSDQHFGPGELNGVGSEGNLPPTRDLPADPAALTEIFENEAAVSSASVPTNVKVFEYATSVILQTGSSPELRAALYELLADLDGVQLTGDERDPLGRQGTAVSIETDYSGASQRDTLIIDEATSQPLSYTETLLEPTNFVDGRLLGYTILQQSGHVEDLGQVPGNR
jgi:hypothetical protein